LPADSARYRSIVSNRAIGTFGFTDQMAREILTCVAEGNQAFAQMRFSGTHVGRFRGQSPTRKPVQWLGAALFGFKDGAIAEL